MNVDRLIEELGMYAATAGRYVTEYEQSGDVPQATLMAAVRFSFQQAIAIVKRHAEESNGSARTTQ